jgi:membrane-associated phospholipid phosphatase
MIKDFLFWQPVDFGFNGFLFFFSHWFLWLLLLGLTGWLWRKKKYYLLFCFWSALVVSIVVKHFSPWVRPFYTSGVTPPAWFAGYSQGSFPSGHGMRSAILLYFFWRENKKLFWLLLPGVILADVGRVLFRLHYPIDIIGGLAIGFVLVKFLEVGLERLGIKSKIRLKFRPC